MGVIILLGTVVLPMAQVSNKNDSLKNFEKTASGKVELGNDSQLTRDWIDVNRSLQLSIVDQQNGKPVAKTRVAVVLLTTPGEFSSGETTLDNKGRCLIKVRQKTFTRLGITAYANGYKTSGINFTPATFTNQCALKLQPINETPISGRVVFPDGSPAANVKGVIISQGMSMGLSIPQTNNVSLESIDPFTAYGLRMYRLGNVGSGPQDMWARIRTDAMGHLEIPSAPYREAIALVHESGYARVAMDAVSSENPIMLTPWGRVEGVLNIGLSPAVRQKVMACNQDDPPKGSFRYRYITETDDQGRFVFSHVPAGPCMVARYYDVFTTPFVDPSITVSATNATGETMVRAGMVARPNLSQPPVPPPVRPTPIFIQGDYAGSTPGNSLEVKPGKVVNVSLGGKGRAIVGKMLATGYSGKIDWRKDLLIGLLISEKTLSASPMTLNRVPTGDSNAGRSKDVIMPGYCVEFQPDGSFRINDVKPGAYRFNVRFSKTLTNAANADVTEVREIAYSNRQVQVSDPDQNSNKSIDLGEIELEIWPDSGRLLN